MNISTPVTVLQPCDFASLSSKVDSGLYTVSNTTMFGLRCDLLNGDSSTLGCIPTGVQFTMISVGMWRADHSMHLPPNESARNWARDRVRLAIDAFAPRRCNPYITARATPPAPSTKTLLS